MKPQEIAGPNDFAMHLLLAPVLAVLTGLCAYWLTGWMDRREERHYHPAE